MSGGVALGVGVCTARNDQGVSYWRVTLSWGLGIVLICGIRGILPLAT